MNLRLSFRAKNNRLTSVSVNHMTGSSDHRTNPDATKTDIFFSQKLFQIAAKLAYCQK